MKLSLGDFLIFLFVLIFVCVIREFDIRLLFDFANDDFDLFTLFFTVLCFLICN